MTLLTRLRNLRRNFFERERVERDLDHEMRDAVARLVEEQIQAGHPPAEAGREARRQLNSVESVKEEIRQRRTGAGLDAVFQDIRCALRVLRRNPAFSLVTVLTLALGIGVTTALFSIVHAVVIDPFPGPGRDRTFARAHSSTTTQGIPDFSGRWKLAIESTRRSERPRLQIRPYEISISQDLDEIRIENPSARWGAQPVTYALSGREVVVVDDSLGDIEHFARKLRSQANWDGRRLTIRTTPFGEQKDERGSINVPAGAITTVHVFRLEGQRLHLDTTAFRAVPPAILHGNPYQPYMDDGLERGFTEVFER